MDKTKKQEKLQRKKQRESFHFSVQWEARKVLGELDGAMRMRLKDEAEWILGKGLKTAFSALTEIVSHARNVMGLEVQLFNDAVNSSVIAYVWGITKENPMDGGKAFDIENTTPLNVGIVVDINSRNELVRWAEPLYGKAMMRMGLPIIKQEGMIFEFRKKSV